MNDAEFVFKETSRERKQVARSARNVVRGGGRVVRMPSDILTKRELSALNGEVKGYNLSSPMTWSQFRMMPMDLQQEYLNISVLLRALAGSGAKLTIEIVL